MFGVLATGFSVLLGFIIFLAFTSYDQSRAGGEAEALVLVQQVENAQQFPPSVAPKLTGQLICYGRSVVGVEWPRMQDGTIGDAPNPWGSRSSRRTGASSRRPPASSPRTTSGSTRPRRARRPAGTASTGPSGVIPTQLWIVLFFISAVIFVYMLSSPTEASGLSHKRC